MTRWWTAAPAPDLPVEWLLALLPELAGRSCFVSRSGREVAGLGEAAVIEADGPRRIEALGRAARALTDDLAPVGDIDVAPPTLMGGFAFNDRTAPTNHGPWRGWRSARMVLPEVQLRRSGGQATLLAVAPAGLDRDSAEVWLNQRMAAARGALDGVLQDLPDPDETLVDTGSGPTAAAWGLATTALNDEFEPEPSSWPARHERSAGSLALHTVAEPAPLEEPFEGLVSRALEAIHGGTLTKVTVARARRFGRLRRRAPVRVLRTLRRRYPDCFRFWIEPAGGTAFVGASPERLIARAGATLRADALAGTVGRSDEAAADANLGALLLANNKERREHEAVVSFLRRRLAPFAQDGIQAESTPELLRLVNVQHLHTPFTVELAPESANLGALELAAAVHPTPAVAGVPAGRATQWIADHEDLDRGWYAGGVGILDVDGDGEFCVAIRSGVFDEDALWLFAGAGVVAGSDPDRERREVEQKMRALRDVLVEE